MKEKSERKAPINLYRLFGVSTPEQHKAISGIDEIVLDLILLSLDTKSVEAITKPAMPFETFELGVAICETIGLPTGIWVTVAFQDPAPVISWTDEELTVMKSKSVAELQSAVAALRQYRGRSDLVKKL